LTREPRQVEIVVCVSPRTGEHSGRGRWNSIAELELRALELALLLAKQQRARTTAVSVGSQGVASQVLTECLARGIDRGVHVAADVPVEDGLAVAACLAGVLRANLPDVVICAQHSENGAHGIVPAALATQLGLPVVSNVVDLQVEWATREAVATQMIERGGRWGWRAALPMVCAVGRDLETPRYLAAVRRLSRNNAADRITVVRPDVASLIEESKRRFGAHRVESHDPARIRPKKTKTPPKELSAADRMKFLRGGGIGQASGDDSPRVFAGPPDEAAREIVSLLEQHELI
jgi:electron transfer flavoprotein alpha/beta subunit